MLQWLRTKEKEWGSNWESEIEERSRTSRSFILWVGNEIYAPHVRLFIYEIFLLLLVLLHRTRIQKYIVMETKRHQKLVKPMTIEMNGTNLTWNDSNRLRLVWALAFCLPSTIASCIDCNVQKNNERWLNAPSFEIALTQINELGSGQPT